MRIININEMQTININEMQTIHIDEPDNQSALILTNIWVCGCTFGTGGCWTSTRNAKVHHCFCCSSCFWALATLCAENWIWKSHWKPCECCRSEKKSETVCDCNPPRVPLILMHSIQFTSLILMKTVWHGSNIFVIILDRTFRNSWQGVLKHSYEWVAVQWRSRRAVF